jgi:hypothetical protein
MSCHSVHRKTQAQLSGYISTCDTNQDVCTTTTRPSQCPYRYTYEAKRITRETVTATSELKLPLRVAALCVLPVCLAVLALALEVAEVGVETLRVELMAGEVVRIEAFAAPTWMSKYMPWKVFERKNAKISKLRSCGLGGRRSQMHSNGLGRTYRYVVYEIENRYGDVGAGQVRGRRELGQLRE